VVAHSVSEPPAHGFCVQCAFLCEYIPDPVEMMGVRKVLDADRKDEAACAASARGLAGPSDHDPSSWTPFSIP
jgi:hypothetical protein